MPNDAQIKISTVLLRTLHRIHRQKTDLDGQIARGPRQIKAGDALVAKAESEMQVIKENLTKANLLSDEKQLQLKSREDKIVDLQTKLNSAASNREFDLLKEQIAADKQANSVLSDEILEAMEAIDELDRLLAQKSKTPLFTNTAKYFTSKKRRKTLKSLHEKVYKDTLYNQASRELIGFKFENHAAWVGCPLTKICSWIEYN